MTEIEAQIGNGLGDQREVLRNRLVQIPDDMSGEPKTWFSKVARTLIEERRRLDSYPPQLSGYIAPIINRGIDILRDEAALHKGIVPSTITNEYRGLRAETRIMELSREMAANFAPNLEPANENVVTIDELIEAHPDIFKLSKEIREDKVITIFNIKDPNSELWHSTPMPLAINMWFKGGLARAILKAHVGADYSSELPWNDLDVVFVGDDVIARDHARLMGVDPDGVESLGTSGESLDFTEYVHGRDITMNQVCFGIDGLHFTEEALEAAINGYIELTAEYMPNRAIYGVDKLKKGDIDLIKPRGLMRFVKSVTEGKARYFNYPEVNRAMGLGVYSLVLAKRWCGREDFGDRLQGLFYLAKTMGLVPDGQDDVYDYLEETHAKFPFFDLDKKIVDMPDVVRWKIGKFIKQIDREFSWKLGIPSLINLPREDGDNDIKIVSMGNFTPDPEESERIRSRWPRFVEECRKRRIEFDKQDKNGRQRYFYDLDAQTPPSSEEEE